MMLTKAAVTSHVQWTAKNVAFVSKRHLEKLTSLFAPLDTATSPGRHRQSVEAKTLFFFTILHLLNSGVNGC